MKFAFAGIDFLGGVFEGLLDAGWTPVKLFTRPCDGVYDHNEVIVARARSLKLPIQLSRIRERDIEALQAEHGRDWALVVAGYPWLIKGWKGRAAYGLNFHPSPCPRAEGPTRCSGPCSTATRPGASPPTCWPTASTPAISWHRRSSP